MRAIFVLALLCTASAALAAPPPPQPGTRVGRFQPMPQDDSMKPTPPKTTGRIDFVGNTSFTPDQLKQPMADQIKEIDAEGLTRPRADDAAFYLESYYRKQGFPEAE